MTPAQAKQVFDLFKGQWPSNSVMHLFFRTLKGRIHVDVAPNPETLERLTEWATGSGYNCYVQVNPTYAAWPGRARTDTITHWSWFLVDLDPTGPDPDLDGAEDFVMGFLSNYLGIIHLHAVVIDSGRGRQLWFPLDTTPTDKLVPLRTEPLPRHPDAADILSNTRMVPMREAAPRAMAYWLGVLRDRMPIGLDITVDTSVSDLPRVMRLPFTINQKTGRRGSILSTQPRQNVGLADKLLHYAPYRLWKERAVVPIGGGTWPAYLSSMTVGGRKFVTEGQQGEGGRHRAASAAMLSLLELGCPLDEVKAAIRFGGQLCQPVLPPSETDPMVERRRGKWTSGS